MGTTLFDQSGKRVDVDDAQVTSKLLSGELRTDKPVVNVQTAEGKVFQVPTQNLGKFAQGAPGLKVMSDSDMEARAQAKVDAENQERYGGAGSMAHVALMSTLSGLTLGGSDYLAGKVLTDEQKLELQREKEANPYTNIGAGVVGAILPTLATGGAAAPEEAGILGLRGAVGAGEELSTAERVLSAAKGTVTAPTRALDALSGFAEKGVAKLVGSNADTFIGQLAQKAVTKAVGGAVTGGLATGAMDIGENEISPDHNLTGEQLLHDMGIGALLGGGLGGLGGAGGAVIDKALAGEPGEGGAIKKWLEGKAEERQWFATGAKTPETRALERQGLTKNEVGRWALDNLPKYTEDGSAPMTTEAIGKAADRAVEETGPKVGLHINDLDASGAVPKWQETLDRLRSEVVQPLEQHIDPAVKSVANRVGGLIDNAEAKLGANPSFNEMFQLRQDVQNAINYSKKDLTQATANGELKKVRAIIEDEIGKQGEQALGPEWKSGYDSAKRDYRMAVNVQDAVESAQARIASHNPISLETSIIGAHGITGMALGHPAALLTAGAAAVGRHLLKYYGDAVGSRLLNAISRSGALETTVASGIAAKAVTTAQRNYTGAMARGLASITSGALASNAPGRPKSLDSDYSEKSKMVKTMLADPKAHAMQLTQNASSLGPNFATVGSAYQRSGLAASVTLANALPKPKPIDPLTPKAGTIEPSPVEKAKFVQVFNAVQDPLSLLHRAADGTLTRDQLNAVATTHPAILQDMQKQLTQELKTIKEPLAPAQMAAVRMILGEPVFDHPINPQAPPPPAPKVTTAGAGKGLSKPLKLDTASTVGLVGSRVRS